MVSEARPALLLGLACALWTSACLPSTVLSKEDRVAIEREQAPIPWVPAAEEALLGTWESTAIEGEAAAVVWKIYYHFVPGGAYSGAALVLGEEYPEFQTLSGTWSLVDGSLALNEDEAVPAFTHEDLLRLESPGGSATFRRVRL